MNPDLPPPNRAIGWYRFMLWMMPTCIAITTALGWVWLDGSFGLSGDLSVVSWTLLNVALIFIVGVLEAKLKRRARSGGVFKTDLSIIQFFLLQLLIIPVLSCIILVAGWVASALFAIAF